MPPSPSRPVKLWGGNARKTGGSAKRRPALASREPDSAVALAFLVLMTPTFLFICNRSMCTAFYSAIFIKHHFFFFFASPHSLPNYHCGDHTAWHPVARVPGPVSCQRTAGAHGRRPLLSVSRSRPDVPAPHVHSLSCAFSVAASRPRGALIGYHTLYDTVHRDHKSTCLRGYQLDRPLPMTATIYGARWPWPTRAGQLAYLISILKATHETAIHSTALRMGKVRLREVQQVT